jgi:hypothetical protein
MNEDHYDPCVGEMYAEFVASWVSGGGMACDAPIAWANGIARANGYWYAPEGDLDDEDEDSLVSEISMDD